MVNYVKSAEVVCWDLIIGFSNVEVIYNLWKNSQMSLTGGSGGKRSLIELKLTGKRCRSENNVYRQFFQEVLL